VKLLRSPIILCFPTDSAGERVADPRCLQQKKSTHSNKLLSCNAPYPIHPLFQTLSLFNNAYHADIKTCVTLPSLLKKKKKKNKNKQTKGGGGGGGGVGGGGGGGGGDFFVNLNKNFKVHQRTGYSPEDLFVLNARTYESQKEILNAYQEVNLRSPTQKRW